MSEREMEEAVAQGIKRAETRRMQTGCIGCLVIALWIAIWIGVMSLSLSFGATALLMGAVTLGMVLLPVLWRRARGRS